jgi:hypothetical protein
VRYDRCENTRDTRDVRDARYGDARYMKMARGEVREGGRGEERRGEDKCDFSFCNMRRIGINPTRWFTSSTWTSLGATVEKYSHTLPVLSKMNLRDQIFGLKMNFEHMLMLTRRTNISCFVNFFISCFYI